MKDKPASEYIEQLKADPKVQEWLSRFKYGNKDKFIESYVKLKYKFKEKPPKEDVNDSYRTEYIEMAEMALEAILAKKIFDLEIRWRAKEITIEGVRIGYDIGRWMREPVNCPFGLEITEEDIEIMKAFLVLPDFERYKLDEYEGNWHNEIREALNDSSDEFHWFQFYNKHVSNPTPTDLPDIKGAKEEYYREMNFKLNQNDNSKNKFNKPTYTYLEYDKHYIYKKKLAEAAGLQDFLSFLKDKEYVDKGRNPIDSDYAWYYLNIHYNDTIPIQANKNWSKALDLSYQQHAARGAAEHLHTVVDAYRIKKENNITKEKKGDKQDRIAKIFIDSILDGREKLGEPRNFDY